MDLRETVEIVAKGYEWLCPNPQCEEMQEEDTIRPDVPDLTCQSCGANYIKGEARHVQ
jgi:hypothetical protein